jgi:hypothetical protein
MVTDLLCITPPSIPEGAHAMTHLVELPPADAGLAPHRHSGPAVGYIDEELRCPTRCGLPRGHDCRSVTVVPSRPIALERGCTP